MSNTKKLRIVLDLETNDEKEVIELLKQRSGIRTNTSIVRHYLLKLGQLLNKLESPDDEIIIRKTDGKEYIVLL